MWALAAVVKIVVHVEWSHHPVRVWHRSVRCRCVNAVAWMHRGRRMPIRWQTIRVMWVESTVSMVVTWHRHQVNQIAQYRAVVRGPSPINTRIHMWICCMHPSNTITVHRYNRARINRCNTHTNTSSTRIRIVNKTLAWIPVRKSTRHTHRWIHRGVHKTKAPCSHTTQRNRFICGHASAPLNKWFSSNRTANGYHLKCRNEPLPSHCNNAAMIQPGAQYGQMGKPNSPSYVNRYDRPSFSISSFFLFFSLSPNEGCAKQLKMVVLAQFSHLEVIAVPIVCIVTSALIAQHRHNGNEKVIETRSNWRNYFNWILTKWKTKMISVQFNHRIT